jgi:hypothetical protein
LAGIPWTSIPTRGRGGVGQEVGAGLFDDFAAGGVPDFDVVGVDMSAREEPALQTAVMDQKKALAVRRENEPRAGDVTRHELRAREWREGALEEQSDELTAFDSLAVSWGSGRNGRGSERRRR